MTSLLGDHLWQSTLFAAAVSLLALALRRNHAQVRYWLWLAASLKFLVPFAALSALGSGLEWRAPLQIEQPAVVRALDIVGQPFSTSAGEAGDVATTADGPAPSSSPLVLAVTMVWLLGASAIVAAWLARWRRVAATLRAGAAVSSGPEFDALRRLERVAGVVRPTALVMSSVLLEPGAFGIVRHVLVWPSRIGARLTAAQVDAIMAHELAHVRRRDNLTAALHMVVQAVVWFHPLVWWLGVRLVAERERACDQDVINLGADPEAYAEGILTTARCCVESPLMCAAGVTGSDLKRRIEAIMRREFGAALSASRKVMLTAAGVGAIAGPLAAGVPGMPQVPLPPPVTDATQRFAVVSVKPNRTEGFGSMSMPAEGFRAIHMPLRVIIELAYGLDRRQLIDAPEWIAQEPFDIEARADAPATPAQTREMLRALLYDRFGMRVRHEARDTAVLALVLAGENSRPGPALTPLSAMECAAAPPRPPAGNMPPPCGLLSVGHGRLQGRAVTMAQLAGALSRGAGLDRMVVDRTGLEGEQQFAIRYSEPPAPAGVREARGLGPLVADPNLADLSTEMRDRLGLQLEPRRAPVEVLIIDRIERPAEN